MKRVLALLFLVLTGCGLNACGKSDDSSSGASPVTVPGAGVVVTTTNTYSMTTGIFGDYPQFFANYQFKEGTCDTDLHKFSGPSPDVARAQLCAGLQNEWMNHGCARGMRQAYWQQMCR